MRSAPISKLFLLLLSTTFLLVVLFSVRFTYKFAQFSAEASTHAQSLQDTSKLNRRLRDKLNEQINLVYQQLEYVDPAFPSRFSAINFELGDEQTLYLKLNIGPEERLTVERIKTLQSELALQGLQIHHQLQSNNRTQAVLRLGEMKTVENKISTEFAGLNTFQTNKLRAVQDQLNETVSFASSATYGLATYLLVTLLAFTILLRRRVLQPLRAVLDCVNKVRHGDFSARAPARRQDELGQLAHGFNFMAESLAESYASLEQKVEERTKQLQDLQQQLIQSAKMSAVGRMLSGMAHELNNPLTVIMGHTELAGRRLIAAGADSAEVEFMENLHEQGQRCRRIVANLLQFARQEPPRLEAVRLNDLVEQALQLREFELKTRNIELIREFDSANTIFCVDRNKIVQIVLNLLNNAHDAIREEGRPGKIWVRTSADDKKVRLEFSDNGTGLREPERVFDPFYTTKEVGQGTGLGLSVCYGIVEEHAGSIRAENWEQGARFTILLPIGTATPTKILTDQKEAMSQPRQKYKALVVDDEATLVNMQTSFLAEIGVAADGVGSGAEAILYLQSHQVDIVISDVRMPGAVDGIELYKWVGRNRPNLIKHFLFVSGDMIGMNGGEFFLQSTVPRIQKPFVWDDYSSLVQQMLDQRPPARPNPAASSWVSH
jgi:signal transduction histidine kinase